jgi:hypothetical protein
MPRRRNKEISYYGRFTLGNFLDWAVTLGLGGILGYGILFLGGVRPETNIPVFVLLSVVLALHGLWLAVDAESPRRLSPVPFLFLPLLIWIGVSAFWLSPAPWRGQYEFLHAFAAFAVFWVLLNNVRTRSHLWALIILVLVPVAFSVLLAFYQYFQSPNRILGDGSGQALMLDPVFAGQATGTFADPNSFVTLLVLLLPVLFVSAAAPRFPWIIRLFCGYSAVMFVLAALFAQVYWPLFIAVPCIAAVCWFSFRTVGRRIVWALVISFTVVLVAGVLFLLHPGFREGALGAFVLEGEAGRLATWLEALRIGLDHPVAGAGAGGFQFLFGQSPRVATSVLPATPHNDFLLVFSQLGAVGLLLFIVPVLLVSGRAYRTWRSQPYRLRQAGGTGYKMPPARFFISAALAGLFGYGLCMLFAFPFHVPALTLLGTFFFAILVKNSFERSIVIPASGPARLAYFLAAALLGFLFQYHALPLLRAQGQELTARQRLEQVVERQLHLSGDPALLAEVIERFEEAVAADPSNADSWIGLSAARCQQVYRDPTSYRRIADAALDAAARALEIADRYWRAWAQYGVALALRGDAAAAGEAFARAVEIAPNNSNALYYRAAFLAQDAARRGEALELVGRSLEIHPDSRPARRLQQLLRIP